MMPAIAQMTVQELKERMDRGAAPVLIDVREPQEYQICNLGARLIPLSEIPSRLGEIPRDREVVVHCKSGHRSQMVAEYLAQAGYTQVANLSGGILAWADAIDPTMRKY